MKKKIHTENAPKAVGPYSQAIEVNDLLFISGQLPLNHLTMEMEVGIVNQTKKALDNLKAIAIEANYNLDNAVKITVLLDNMNDFSAMNEVYVGYFNDPYPARVCYEVSKLPLGALIEIDAIITK